MQLHRYLRDVKKVPDLVLLLGFLAIPVTIGKPTLDDMSPFCLGYQHARVTSVEPYLGPWVCVLGGHGSAFLSWASTPQKVWLTQGGASRCIFMSHQMPSDLLLMRALISLSSAAGDCASLV